MPTIHIQFTCSIHLHFAKQVGSQCVHTSKECESVSIAQSQKIICVSSKSKVNVPIGPANVSCRYVAISKVMPLETVCSYQ